MTKWNGSIWSIVVAVALAAAAVLIQHPNVPISCGWWTWPFC